MDHELMEGHTVCVDERRFCMVYMFVTHPFSVGFGGMASKFGRRLLTAADRDPVVFTACVLGGIGVALGLTAGPVRAKLREREAASLEARFGGRPQYPRPSAHEARYGREHVSDPKYTRFAVPNPGKK